MIYVLIGLALFFDFLNGFHDSSNIVATVIASRALTPRTTLYLAALAHFVGPFLFGVAVAETVGAGLLLPESVNQPVVIAALISAIIWNLATWYFGLPSSSSHALLGGLMGAAVLASGLEVLQLRGLVTILLALILSPPLGMVAGFLLMRFTLWAARNATPRVNVFFRRIQIVTLIGLGLSHGTNDAQKTMGVIALGLLTAGYIDEFQIPLWVIAISAGAIAIGTAIGGWRLIRTLGGRIIRVRPVHGFTSQLAGASVIMGAAILGGPVSTTQVMGSTITGVGAADRPNRVRWSVARDMVYAWILTLPATALLSGLAYLLVVAVVGS